MTRRRRRLIILHFTGERHECGNQCGNMCPVSQFAVEEFEALQDTLTLERDLRTEAENFARTVSFYSRPPCVCLILSMIVFMMFFCPVCPDFMWGDVYFPCGPFFRWWSSKSSWRGRVRSWCRTRHPVKLCRKPLARLPDWLRIWRLRGWNTRTRSVWTIHHTNVDFWM